MKSVPFTSVGRWLGLALLGLGAVACASDKSLVSHALNNMAARDNGFFLAREKLWATEATLYKGRVDDYNRRLVLYPTLDSTTVRATRPDLNDIIQKASLPIQHRPGSDWTDDAYLLVAWSRFYKMEFDDAELTFKYINSTSRDPLAKQEALIGLMRTFMMQKRPDDARAVSTLLDKERGLPKDARDLFLARTEYYLQADEPKEAIVMLERAIPLIAQKNERSRSRYLLAQLYQEQGDDKKAAAQLNAILKKNPPYELDFNTKLMLAEVSELNEQNTARLTKYFAGLLKDVKNKEYRDRIYYQQARLAYRQKKYPEALTLLQPAAKVPSTSKFQKGYTYLLAGRIYYDNLRRYRLASAYYDSAARAMPKDNPLYASVQERADILREFAKQYTIVETQDSLQKLVKLPADELTRRLNDYAAAELEAKRKAAAKAAAAAKAQAQQANNPAAPSPFAGDARTLNNPTTTDPLNAVASGALWYFDNPTSLSTARQEFIRRWGDRKLQDNWRTLSTPSSSPNDPANGGVPVSATGNDQTQVNGTNPAGKTPAAPDPQAEQTALVATYRQALPDTPAKLEASDKQIEAASYELGGIYKELLKERQRGYETYASQVQRYPQGEHAADADYLLYLYYKDLPDAAKAAQYADNLQRYFPNSTYAKVLRDPLYREHERELHNAVSVRLDSAFALYKDQYFTRAKAVVNRIQAQYPKSDNSDQVAYLKALLAVRTQPAQAARASLELFTKDYPASPLQAQAKALLASYQKAEAGQLTGALASTDKPLISVYRPGEIDNRRRIELDEDDELPTLPAPTTPAPGTTAPTTPPATTPITAPAPSAQPAGAAAGPVPATTQTGRKARALGRKPAVGGAPQPTDPVGLTATSANPVGGGASGAATASPTPPAPAPGTGPTAALTTPPTGTSPTPAGAVPGAAGTTPAVTGVAPAPTGAVPAAAGAAPGAGVATPASVPAAPAVAYATQLSAAHAVVLVYPKGQAPLPDLGVQLTNYDNKYFKAANLQVQAAQALGTGQEMVVVRALPNAKAAQSYATKLRGPQSPLGRLRGQGYQPLVISLANLTLLQQSGGDVAGYQQFYQQVYQ